MDLDPHVNEQLAALAREQQTILKNLMTRLFDKSLQGLNLTNNEIQDLRQRHVWYHSNIYQLHELKKKITSIQGQYDERINEILHEIREQKERAKQILHNALNRLETTMDKNIVRHYLDELIREFDKLIDNTSSLVLLGSIFGALGLFSIIAAIIAAFGGSSLLGVATLGLGAVVGDATSEIMFRSKLSDLNEKLRDNIKNVQNQKSQQLQQLESYFDGFVQKLLQHNSHKLSQEFPSGKYRVFQSDNETAVIQFVQSNIESNIILITSGSAGESVISEIGYYWNIKGIIIFCMLIDNHRSWTGMHKKVLLITNNSNEVVQKIKHIERGDIYFLINGFLLEDVALKLTNTDYYILTKKHGFMIQDFESINSDRSYHRYMIQRFHDTIIAKNLYSNGVPNHFKLTNLFQFVDKFLEALAQIKPEKKIIALYTEEAPYYYKIINDILNRLDEELILLVGDYTKALRYALIVYADTTNTIPNTTNLKLYRGLCLMYENSLQEFQQKFAVNDIIIFPSFLSTSLNKAKATSFINEKGVLLEISADCTQINKPKNISAQSRYKSEDEVLLNCFSVLRVTSITKITDNLVSYKCILEQLE
ncbi:unnamed protein product [Didymodactylos carnosus]|uniref:ADP ribosyltransferase domain-containing protein n=1 Tax=Didymodactylos carnosus TaxID=1234261 RepID=A0A814DCW3_9BILA|nr:unnamed protein product [Didymodactylos carnosus]CAF3729360.1 unnamed protein product [Didymodactylos carnosus]